MASAEGDLSWILPNLTANLQRRTASASRSSSPTSVRTSWYSTCRCSTCCSQKKYTAVSLINPDKTQKMIFKFKTNSAKNYVVRPVYGGGSRSRPDAQATSTRAARRRSW